jgi:hypothetical protein
MSNGMKIPLPADCWPGWQQRQEPGGLDVSHQRANFLLEEGLYPGLICKPLPDEVVP